MNTFKIHMEDKRVKYICERDRTMQNLITTIGDIEVPLRTDYLASLVRSIIGQQISVHAASAIYGRLLDLLDGEITADKLLARSKNELNQVGLTKRKTDYIIDLAGKVLSSELELESINQYNDEIIIKQLMNVKGIGKWTAEVFLILSLGRADVLAVDDVGIQRAAKWLYGVEKIERKQILIEKSPLWKPYRSIVSFYLWEAIHLEFITNYPTIDAVMENVQ